MPPITMHRSTRRWSLLLILLLVASLWLIKGLLPAALRAQQANLRLEPIDLYLQPGEEATIEVWLHDIDGLYGLDLSFLFDPAVMEVLDANPSLDGVQVIGGTFPVPDFEVKNEVSTDEARIRYAVTQLNPREPASGSGMVFSMRIRALDTGISYLDVPEAMFINRDGLEIDVQRGSGEVRVTSSSGQTLPPPPTRTSTATPTDLPPATPTHTATPTVEGVVALATDTPLLATTPTVMGGYPNPTLSPADQGAPSAVPPTGEQGTRSPRPTMTVAGQDQPLSDLTPTGGYPLPGGPTAVAPPSQNLTTPDPFTAPTDAFSVAPRSTDARIAMAIPTLEKVWPQGEAKLEQVDPLIPRETFVCLSAGLVLLTLVVALYVWRRDRIGARPT